MAFRSHGTLIGPWNVPNACMSAYDGLADVEPISEYGLASQNELPIWNPAA